MPDYVTQRGFAMYADIPTVVGNFTVQQSSLATERKVWVGLRDTRAHLSVDEARRVQQALTEFLAASDYADGLWCGECRHGVVEDPPCCTQEQRKIFTLRE